MALPVMISDAMIARKVMYTISIHNPEHLSKSQ